MLRSDLNANGTATPQPEKSEQAGVQERARLGRVSVSDQT